MNPGGRPVSKINMAQQLGFQSISQSNKIPLNLSPSYINNFNPNCSAQATYNKADYYKSQNQNIMTQQTVNNDYYTIAKCSIIWCNNNNSRELFTPVVSCEINPAIVLARRNEKYEDESIAKLTDVKIHYRWQRGPAKTVCFFHLQKVAIIQCTVTLRCFCSFDCFLRGQVQLKKFYLSDGKAQVPRQIDEFSYGVPVRKDEPTSLDETRDPDVEHFLLLQSSGLVYPKNTETWATVGYSKDFTPTPNDVGHQICFSVAVETIKKSQMQPYNSNDMERQLNNNYLIKDSNWWANFDSMLVRNMINANTYSVVITGCVIPMAPLIEKRLLIPINIANCEPLRQRFIHPSTPLAEALGIGMDYRSMCRTTKRNKNSTSIEDQQAIKTIENRINAVRKERINLLTENIFYGWEDACLKTRKQLQFMNFQTNNDSFTVMSWNVLANIYAMPEAYPYSDAHVLSWSFRRDRILSEIITYDPDIICLQEIQGDHFEDFFAPALLRRGYEGLYKQKTTKTYKANGKNKNGKFVCDGCATFFRVPKFQLLDHFGIEFARVMPPILKNGSSKTDKRISKDNVALVLCLEQQKNNNYSYNNNETDHKSGSNILVVANTHILANPEAPDVKIWQANTLTSVLTEYMQKTTIYNRDQGNNKISPGLIVCGDFNSTPNSAVYELATTGTCSYKHPELNNTESCKWLNDVKLGHGLKLISSYSYANYMRSGMTQKYPSSHYEPEFTNYTQMYVGCLDYIFFDAETIQVTATLELVTEIQLLQESYDLQMSDWALPSAQRPSDHLPLLTKFEWKK